MAWIWVAEPNTKAGLGQRGDRINCIMIGITILASTIHQTLSVAMLQPCCVWSVCSSNLCAPYSIIDCLVSNRHSEITHFQLPKTQPQLQVSLLQVYWIFLLTFMINKRPIRLIRFFQKTLFLFWREPYFELKICSIEMFHLSVGFRYRLFVGLLYQFELFKCNKAIIVSHFNHVGADEESG